MHLLTPQPLLRSLIVAHLAEQRITVYDSMRHADARAEENAEIAHWFIVNEATRRGTLVETNFTKWNVHVDCNMTQNDGYNCGMCVLLRIWTIVHRLPLARDAFDAETLNMTRTSLCNALLGQHLSKAPNPVSSDSEVIEMADSRPPTPLAFETGSSLESVMLVLANVSEFECPPGSVSSMMHKLSSFTTNYAEEKKEGKRDYSNELRRAFDDMGALHRRDCPDSPALSSIIGTHKVLESFLQARASIKSGRVSGDFSMFRAHVVDTSADTSADQQLGNFAYDGTHHARSRGETLWVHIDPACNVRFPLTLTRKDAPDLYKGLINRQHLWLVGIVYAKKRPGGESYSSCAFSAKPGKPGVGWW